MKIVSGGTLVTEAGLGPADVGIEGATVAAVGTKLPGEPLFDATGLHVFPGFFDAHVHFCDERPATGRTSRPPAARRSRAASRP